jgi:uncharacterized protein YbjT (DUF2867 family)
VAQAAYHDGDAVRRALDGLETVLMVSAAATAVLTDPSAHAGRTYSLTGPEELTLAEAAATMGRVLGRDVTFEDETVEEAYASRASYRAPD